MPITKRLNQGHTSRRLAAAFVLAFGALSGAKANVPPILVTNTSDSGGGSLRQAILDANSVPGAHTIAFKIPAGGAQTIMVSSALPIISGPVTLDGWQESGFSGTPLIRIDGDDAGPVTGLRLDAGPSTVQGLIITRFGGGGLIINGGSGNVVKGCYIGTDGSTALGNGAGGYDALTIGNTNFSTIGGGGVNDGNVISGNVNGGVLIGSSANNISFYANRIGTNAAGTAAIPNGGYGMRLFGASTVIGNALPNTRNIISGNGSSGIYIEQFVSGTQILGAYIGLNAAGSAALPNAGDGITDRGGETAIGDITPGGGNVISGNTGSGISIQDADGSQVLNNMIGTNPAGTVAIPNQGYGIRGYSGGFIYIGTETAGTGNLISGNGNSGISVESGAAQYLIVGNRIGTNLAGTAALGNGGDGITVSGGEISIGNATAGNLISGNADNGVAIQSPAQNVTMVNNIVGLNASGSAKIANLQYGLRALSGDALVIGQPGKGNVISGNARGVIFELVDGATMQGNVVGLSPDQSTEFGNDEVGVEILGANNQIGGTSAGTGNVIARNALYGIMLVGPGATGNHIEGNILGSNAALTGSFPNLFGVVIYNASGNFIGGTAAGAGNVIANNANNGIYNWFGSQNRFLGNRIYANQRLGIDLEPQGVIVNDPLDADHGPNEGQNYPIVTLATGTASSVSVEGQLSSQPNTAYRVEYFDSLACDPSGVGQGEHYIGFEDVVTDAKGLASLGADLPTNQVDGYVTATATSADGNTSEFSPCVIIGAAAAGEFNIASNPVLAYEDFQIAHVAIVRTQGVTGAVSVHVKTVDGTATSPSDYGAVDQVLNFANGEGVKTIDIPIVIDDVLEGTEQFTVQLSQATGGAFLGPQASVNAILFDHDPALPVYSVGNASTPGPLSGQVQVNVAVKLSGATNHVVTIGYNTQDGSAKAGQDYIATSGQVVFAIGETSKNVPITVTANGVHDADRLFNLLISSAGQVVIAGNSEGEIVINGNDAVFKNGFD